MSFVPYPSYKLSGVSWLGSIPSHWEVGRLKFSADAQSSNVDKVINVEEHPVRLCNYVDVYNNEFITNNLNFMMGSASKNEIDKFSLNKGDVLITKDSESWQDIAVPAHVVEEIDDGVCGYHLAHIRPDESMFHSGYLYRLFCSDMLNYQFKISANGVTRFGLPITSIRDALLVRPPLIEQKAISDFLDREIARIDHVVKKNQLLLSLLAEQKTGKMIRLVTGGLESGVKRKASGYPWLGMIPTHWDVKPLKRIALRIDVGIAEAATHAYVDDGVPIIRTTNVSADSISLDDIRHIDPRFAEKNKSKFLYFGDLLTVRTGVPGTTAVVPKELNGSQCFTMLMTTLSEEMCPRYFSAFLNSAARPYFDAECWGTAQNNISVPILGATPVVVPPPNEQREIASEIDSIIRKYDQLTQAIETTIVALKEFRSTLVTRAVTGTIDVREARVQEAAE